MPAVRDVCHVTARGVRQDSATRFHPSTSIAQSADESPAKRGNRDSGQTAGLFAALPLSLSATP
jgi:hypothetical protein